MPDWQKLVSQTIKDCTPLMVMPPGIFKKFMAMHTPEAIAKYEAERKAEQARLAAIEAAKTPAQKLKEKQDACTHEFELHLRMTPCIRCNLKVTRDYARGYMAGKAAGYEAGYQERGQHDTDEE